MSTGRKTKIMKQLDKYTTVIFKKQVLFNKKNPANFTSQDYKLTASEHC